MLIDKLKVILEKYYTTIAVDDFMTTGDTDVYINPTGKELKDIMFDEMDNRRSVRFIIDKDKRTYVWRWDKATHKTIKNELKIEGEAIGGSANILPYKSVSFDLGAISINRHHTIPEGQMRDIFFSTELAEVLNMNPDNTKVEFYEYGADDPEDLE